MKTFDVTLPDGSVDKVVADKCNLMKSGNLVFSSYQNNVIAAYGMTGWLKFVPLGDEPLDGRSIELAN